MIHTLFLGRRKSAANKDRGVKQKYIYDLTLSDEYVGSFQEFDGPASGKLKPGQREFTLKMGLVRGDAAKTLIEWYKQVTHGVARNARPRDVVVSNTSTMDRSTFERDRVEFLDASMVSLSFYPSSPALDRLVIEKIEFFFAHHESARY